MRRMHPGAEPPDTVSSRRGPLNGFKPRATIMNNYTWREGVLQNLLTTQRASGYRLEPARPAISTTPGRYLASLDLEF